MYAMQNEVGDDLKRMPSWLKKSLSKNVEVYLHELKVSV